MSDEVADSSVDDRSLDAQWQQRIAEIGRRNFENEEMLRLGFISADSLERLETHGLRLAAYQEALVELGQARRELRKTDAHLARLGDVEYLIAQIRARRIERIKAERAERKVARAAAQAERRAETAKRRREQPTFLGRRVSDRLVFHGGDSLRLQAQGLPHIETFAELAGSLELSPERLQWLAYERAADAQDHYTRFEIPKRSGGKRLISSPKPAMRAAQEWILSSILAALPVSAAATAFLPGKSIVDNARAHVGAGTIVRIDLRDFFPSIGFLRVSHFFQALGYNRGVASVLALLVTDAPRVRLSLDGSHRWVVVGERGLPQGACTSPALANLIARGLDARLIGLSRKQEWAYTRYADDLVFSHRDTDADVAGLVATVTRIIGDEGFEVNRSKTRVMRTPNRQMVTGLVVNDGVRLNRTMRRRIRAFLHRCQTLGFEQVSSEIGKDARAVALGYLAFVHMVDPDDARRIRDRNPWL